MKDGEGDRMRQRRWRSVEKEWCVSEEASLERGDGHMTQHRKMAGDH